MKKKIFVSFLILLIFSTPCFAGLIEANVWRGRDVVSVGMSLFGGFGVVSSLDIAIDNKMAFGGSVGVCLVNENPYLMDLHINYQVVEGTGKNPLNLSVVGGLWGGTSAGIWVNKDKKDFYVLPELGVAIDYPIAQRVRGRLNLVYGPSLGIEVGFGISPQLEVIFAISQQVIGAKFVF